MKPDRGAVILIIADDDATRQTLCRALAGTGLSLACARNGAEALEQLTAKTFKMALLDASLFGTAGIETLRVV